MTNEAEQEGPQGSPQGPSSARRPTPVRETVVGQEASSSDPEPQTVSFSTEDGEWVARVAGRGLTGRPGDAGAPILLLTFARADTPDDPVHEVAVAARRMDELSVTQLTEVLRRAGRHRADWSGQEIFAGTRRGKNRRP